MSVKSSFKADDSEYDTDGSTGFSKMSEHLTDLNILQSKKTYGRNKNYGTLSFCSEDSESFPDFVEELYADENFETSTSVTNSSYSKTNTQKVVNPEICLFNDEDTDYYVSGSADSSGDRIASPILATASSGLNYQRTRKNLKNQLNNEQYNSEKTFKLPSDEENSNSVVDDVKKFKSASDFLDLNQATFSAELRSFLSKKSPANSSRIDVKSSDDPLNVLPQKSSKTSSLQVAKQTRKVYGKGVLFENPLINQSIFPIVDLVKRFTVRNNQAPAGDVKSHVINTGNLDIKKGDAKTPSVSARKQNISPLDEVESVDMIGCVRNTDTPKKSRITKTPSDSVQKSSNKSIKVLTKYASKNDVKAKVTHITSNLHLIRNVSSGNIHSDDDGKQIEKLSFVHSKENAVQNQFLNNTPIIFGSIPTVSQDTTPLSIQNVANSHSIQNDNQAVSYRNLEDLTIPDPSTLTNLSNNRSNTENNEYDTEIKPRNDSNIADNHSIQNDNQFVSYRNVEDLAVPDPSTLTNLSNNRSNMEIKGHNKETEPKNGRFVYLNKTTTVTTFLENPVNHKQTRRARSFAPLAVSIVQYADDYFQRTENMCVLKKQEIADEIFSKHPSLLDTTVTEFCNHPGLTDIFCDYLIDYVNISPGYDDVKKGYDFPENFETENLMRVAKDFVHSIIYYIVPRDGPKPSEISYLKILNATKHMSSAESAIVMRVFKMPSFKMLKLNDVLSKLHFVALLAIVYEYKSRQIVSNLKK